MRVLVNSCITELDRIVCLDFRAYVCFLYSLLVTKIAAFFSQYVKVQVVIETSVYSYGNVFIYLYVNETIVLEIISHGE